MKKQQNYRKLYGRKLMKTTLILTLFLLVLTNLTADNELEIVWQTEAEQEEDYYGSSIAALDFNGDNISDLAICAYSYNIDPENTSYSGKIYIYYGSDNGLSTTRNWTCTQSVDTTFHFLNINSIWSIGDMNGDSCDDLAYLYKTSPELGEFQAYTKIILGGADPDSIPDYSYECCFDTKINPLGDINGDGYDDVGLTDGGGPVSFRIIYGGSFEKVPFVEDVSIRNGRGFRGLGDVNNDGFDDFSYYYETDPVQQPDSTYLFPHHNRFFFGGNVQDTIPDYSLDLLMYNRWAELAPAGDWNGDGYDDFVLSGVDVENNTAIGCRIWFGNDTLNWDAYNHIQYYADFLPSYGDLNADGKGDLVSIHNTGYTGYFYIYLGDLNGTADYDVGYDYEGFGSRTVADFNNDGYDDIAVGARGGDWYEGKAFVFAGHTGLTEQDPTPVNSNVIPSNIKFKAYPNPMSRNRRNQTINFEIEAKDYDNLQIEIFNVKGQKVDQLTINNEELIIGKKTWNVGNNASGIYFCKLKSKNEILKVKKITLFKQ